MVRGLLFRQVFVVVDLSLALLVAFVIYLVSAKLLDTGAVAPPVQSASADVPQVAHFQRVASRDQYDGIVRSGLFGPAGQAKRLAEAAPASVNEVSAPPTLKLYGTAASFPNDPLATAVIENSASRAPLKVATYYLDQQVTDELFLIEVYPRKVVLNNAVKNQREVLEMPELASSAGAPAGPLGHPVAHPNMPSERAPDYPQITRAEVNETLNNTSYQDLMTTLNPRMANDGHGNIQGVTSGNIASLPVLTKAGLQNGDIVESVNGMNLRSEQDIMEAFSKFNSSRTIRLGILRNGAPQMLTIGIPE
jgi:type II secretory pathway component PulC